jgi:hypothetical protein
MFIKSFRSTKAIDICSSTFASRLFLAAIFAIGVLVAPAHAQTSGGPVIGTPCPRLGTTELSADRTDILACLYAPAPTLLWERFGGQSSYVTVTNDCQPAVNCNVVCPAASHVTGGGCSLHNQPAMAPLTLTAPSGNGWTCSVWVPANVAMYITAYAICAGP